ncbi:hypothetical protein E2542_SST18237 [Spatholobus suberectus]|nr:hypothetical protein E2542_SST18237 [Spatholobus suberectus]
MGDMEEANLLLAEAEAADCEAEKLQSTYKFEAEDFTDLRRHLISMDLILHQHFARNQPIDMVKEQAIEAFGQILLIDVTRNSRIFSYMIWDDHHSLSIDELSKTLQLSNPTSVGSPHFETWTPSSRTPSPQGGEIAKNDPNSRFGFFSLFHSTQPHRMNDQ